jgi:hypothetical protein
LEYEDVLPLRISEINKEFSEVYPPKYIIKLPRYLIQLESIDIITSETRGGEILWSVNVGIFHRLLKDPIIDPVRAIIE